jgi:hypothetical protein
MFAGIALVVLIFSEICFRQRTYPPEMKNAIALVDRDFECYRLWLLKKGHSEEAASK